MSAVFFILAADIVLMTALVWANYDAAPTQAGRDLKIGQKKFSIGHVICGLTVSMVYPLLVLVLGRPVSSFVLGLLLVLLLWAGNRLKVSVLAEVLVFSDVFLAGHALRYPRLYFGYAPMWVWPLLGIGIGALIWGISLEPAVSWSRSTELVVCVLLALALLLLFVLFVRRPRRSVQQFLQHYPLTFDAQTDAAMYTPVGAAFLHVLWHGQRRKALREMFRLKNMDIWGQDGGRKRHLLLIQAESYARVDKLLHRPSVTPFLDALCSQTTSGPLELDWRGAYTMRSEFAVLTGIRPRTLETYGFDPYRLAAVEPMDSIARRMKSRGYRTVACHPNDGRFFDRNSVMPNLGFDEFLDLNALIRLDGRFAEASSRCGRYVSDEALLRWAVDYLSASAEPVFLFIITMEAHGPWSKDKFPGAEQMTEVERYEEHLKHLDAGIRRIVEVGSEWERDSHPFGLDVCVYGDHLPGLQVLRGNEAEISTNTIWLKWPRLGTEGSHSRRVESLMRETCR